MDETVCEKLEELAMVIIANSGAARSGAFEALNEARNGKYESAEAFMKNAEESMQKAHEAHRVLLQMDASGQVTQTGILLCHSQDHLMGSALAKDLISEMILMYREMRQGG